MDRFHCDVDHAALRRPVDHGVGQRLAANDDTLSDHSSEISLIDFEINDSEDDDLWSNNPFREFNRRRPASAPVNLHAVQAKVLIRPVTDPGVRTIPKTSHRKKPSEDDADIVMETHDGLKVLQLPTSIRQSCPTSEMGLATATKAYKEDNTDEDTDQEPPHNTQHADSYRKSHSAIPEYDSESDCDIDDYETPVVLGIEYIDEHEISTQESDTELHNTLLKIDVPDSTISGRSSHSDDQQEPSQFPNETQGSTKLLIANTKAHADLELDAKDDISGIDVADEDVNSLASPTSGDFPDSAAEEETIHVKQRTSSNGGTFPAHPQSNKMKRWSSAGKVRVPANSITRRSAKRKTTTLSQLCSKTTAIPYRVGLSRRANVSHLHKDLQRR